jgi:hypothetical protein
MSNIDRATLPAAWAAWVPELAGRSAAPAGGSGGDAARWFDQALDSAELLRAPATPGSDSAATLSARFLDSLLVSTN